MLTNIKKSADELKLVVLTNIIKMLINRNYLNKAQFENYISKIQEKLNRATYTFSDDVNKDNKQIININFLTDSSITKKQSIFKNIEFNSVENHYIFIVVDPKVSKYLKELKHVSNVELFNYSDFFVDKASYILTPPHRQLSPEESIQILEQYNVTFAQLPKILRTDPMIRYYNMPTGSICEITPVSEISGAFVRYRGVINSV